VLSVIWLGIGRGRAHGQRACRDAQTVTGADVVRAEDAANHREVARYYIPLTGRDEPDCQMQL
ncbi:MAG: hypothetical protein KAW49_10620, partial [Anaerolineae bacterium]|nr:hypothetical protein [Anaerolineae bacterium]